MGDEHRIPAASINDVDLDVIAQLFPEEAREIARLDDLMQHGKETPEEFRRLCELLHMTGESSEAEYLLRRNIIDDRELTLYEKLFGTAIPDNFAFAVKRFAEDFDLDLTLREERDFLDQEYLSIPLTEDHPRFNILNATCLINFDYGRRDHIVAEAIAADAESTNLFNLNSCLFLRWRDDQWRLLDPRDA